MSKKIAVISVATVFTLIFILASGIQISKMLFPIFLAGLILSAIWLVYKIIRTYLDSYGDYEEAAMIPGTSLIIFLLLTGITYFVGHIFGDSDIGKAITATSAAIDTANEAKTNATLALIDASQQTTHQIALQSNNSRVTQDEKNINTTFDILRIGVKIDK